MSAAAGTSTSSAAAAVGAIARRLFRDSTPTEPSDRVLQAVAEELGWPSAGFWQRRDDTVELAAVWSSGDLDDAGVALRGQVNLAREALEKGKPVWTEGGAGVAAGEPASASGLAFPIVSGDEPVTSVTLHAAEPRALDQDQAEIAAALGPMLGDWQERLVVERERLGLARRLGEAEERQRLLADASRLLAESSDEQKVLTDLAETLVPNLADACSVHLIQDDGNIERVAVAATPELVERAAGHDVGGPTPGFADEAGVGRCIRTGLGVLYSRVTDALLMSAARNEAHLSLLRSVAPVSAMVVPISGHGRVLGALAVISADSARLYTADDLSLLEEVGRRAGIAIAGSRIIRRERDLATKLQAGLLPPTLPQPEWMELAARYQAGRPDALVGGDFYDGFAGRDGRVVLAIGDVCGHGPEAASLTARIRYAARALSQYLDSPTAMLEAMNQLMLQDAPGESVFTAIYGLVEPIASGLRLTLARAGHPPPLVLRSSGAIEEVMGPGTILGCYPQISLSDQVIELEPGDALVLYTDGVTDARRGPERFGEERLREALGGAAAGWSPHDVVGRLMSILSTYDPEPIDDIALLAVAPRTPPG